MEETLNFWKTKALWYEQQYNQAQSKLIDANIKLGMISLQGDEEETEFPDPEILDEDKGSEQDKSKDKK